VYANEPMNPQHPPGRSPGVLRAEVAHAFQYISEDNEGAWLPAFRDTVRLRFHPLAELRRNHRPYDLARTVKYTAGFALGRLRGRRADRELSGGVFLTYASGKGRALVDGSCTCPPSGLPTLGGAPRRTCPSRWPSWPGRSLLRPCSSGRWRRACRPGGDRRWVYGGDAQLRAFLEQRDVAYVLAVKATQPLWAAGTQGPAELPARELVARLPARAWQRLSPGDGAKGPRVYDSARVALTRPGWPGCRFLAAGASAAVGGGAGLLRLLGPARTVPPWPSWWGGRDPLDGGGMLPGRRGPGRPGPLPGPLLGRLYRHVTLVLVAQAFLAAAVRAQAGEGGSWARRTATTSRFAKFGAGSGFRPRRRGCWPPWCGGRPRGCGRCCGGRGVAIRPGARRCHWRRRQHRLAAAIVG
jgi:hypothetical protein